MPRRRRAAVDSPESHDDEGLRPDHLRACRQRLLSRSCSKNTRPCWRSSAFEPNNGIGDLYAKTRRLARETNKRPSRPISMRSMPTRPKLAMVDSDKGITNLHVPSDVIIDASMPAAIRASGKMWGPDGKLHDMKAIIPDRCYAGVYQAMIDFCKENGAFDVTTMGSVANVGLMAQKAEEYGSHDKTFEIPRRGNGSRRRLAGRHRLESTASTEAISGGCAKPRMNAIRDWVRLAVSGRRATGSTAIFWLDEDRAHDANLIDQSQQPICLSTIPRAWTFRSCRRWSTRPRVSGAADGQGYDLGHRQRVARLLDRPVSDSGTRHERKNVVDRAAAGRWRLVRNGCGRIGAQACSAIPGRRPFALGFARRVSGLGGLPGGSGQKTGNAKAAVLVRNAERGKRPSCSTTSRRRKVHELDNRGSHFYLALYWAEALAAQTKSPELQDCFRDIARQLRDKELTIIDELNAAQGNPVDIGGYYQPDPEKMSNAMRPSVTFNAAVNALGTT